MKELLEKLELLYWLNEEGKITYDQYKMLENLTIEEIKLWMKENQI